MSDNVYWPWPNEKIPPLYVINTALRNEFSTLPIRNQIRYSIYENMSKYDLNLRKVKLEIIRGVMAKPVIRFPSSKG